MQRWTNISYQETLFTKLGLISTTAMVPTGGVQTFTTTTACAAEIRLRPTETRARSIHKFDVARARTDETGNGTRWTNGNGNAARTTKGRGERERTVGRSTYVRRGPGERTVGVPGGRRTKKKNKNKNIFTKTTRGNPITCGGVPFAIRAPHTYTCGVSGRWRRYVIIRLGPLRQSRRRPRYVRCANRYVARGGAADRRRRYLRRRVPSYQRDGRVRSSKRQCPRNVMRRGHGSRDGSPWT